MCFLGTLCLKVLISALNHLHKKSMFLAMFNLLNQSFHTPHCTPLFHVILPLPYPLGFLMYLLCPFPHYSSRQPTLHLQLAFKDYLCLRLLRNQLTHPHNKLHLPANHLLHLPSQPPNQTYQFHPPLNTA